MPKLTNAQSTKEIGVRNPYLSIDKKFLQKPKTWGANAEKCHVGAGRFQVIGNPGTGKSMWVYTFIKDVIQLKNIDNLVLLCASLHSDPLYLSLLHEATEMGISGIACDNLDGICGCDGLIPAKSPKGKAAAEEATVCPKLHFRDFDPSETTVLICDDLISKAKPELRKLLSFWTMGRRQGITAVFCTQNDTSTPIELRRTTDVRVVKNHGMNYDDLQRLLLSLTSKDNVPKIMELWKQICSSTDKTHFLMIDVHNSDPDLRFRFNYRKTHIPGLI